MVRTSRVSGAMAACSRNMVARSAVKFSPPRKLSPAMERTSMTLW